MLGVIGMAQFMQVPAGLQIGAVIVALAIAVILHEVSHGLAALQLGDPTAKLAGRLSLNPIKHVDLWGTIIVPGILLISQSLLGGGFIFGWAKPVPVNYYNLRGGKWSPVVVALAGPAMNLLILIAASLLARMSPAGTSLPYLFGVIALVNGWLMVFNLLPVPPLDGSKILYVILERRPDIIQLLERNGILLLVLLLVFGGAILRLAVYPVVGLMAAFAGPEVLQLVLTNLPG